MKKVMNAPAKINLALDITGRRSDGYHTIAGVMQAISLCDTVTVEVTDPVDGMYLCVMGPRPGMAEEINLSCTNPELPADRRNLAFRAAETFFSVTGRGCRRLDIHIEKRIPAAAGLAGGSTDAAAVLAALNELFGSPLSTAALCEAGVSLGADVPFCILGGAQVTEGVGEILSPISPLPDCELVIACGGEGVSTPAAYGVLDALYGDFRPDAYAPREAQLTALKTALEQGELNAVCGNLFNIFETVILPERPIAREIRSILLEEGAMAAMMSGSGPAVFGIFQKGDGRAQRAKTALEARGIPAWVCAPMGDSL